MKDEQLDTIMKKHIGNINSGVDIEHAVMNRIREYEERKSARFFLWEYVLSGLVLFAGFISIFLIKFVFKDYTALSDWYSIYVSVIRWFSIVMFAAIVLSVVLFSYFASAARAGESVARQQG
jgi:hypothetical protein